MIQSDDLAFGKDMSLHGLFEVRFCRIRAYVEHGVQGVYLEEVAVGAGRRTWSPIRVSTKIIHPLYTPRRNGVFCDLFRARVDIPDHPMDPHPHRRIGVIRDEGYGLSFLRSIFDHKRRTDILAIAGVLPGDMAVILKSGACYVQCSHATYLLKVVDPQLSRMQILLHSFFFV